MKVYREDRFNKTGSDEVEFRDVFIKGFALAHFSNRFGFQPLVFQEWISV